MAKNVFQSSGTAIGAACLMPQGVSVFADKDRHIGNVGTVLGAGLLVFLIAREISRRINPKLRLASLYI